MIRITSITAILGMTAALATSVGAAPPVFQTQPYVYPSTQVPTYSQPRSQPYLRPQFPQQPGYGRVSLGFYGDFHEGHGMHVNSVVPGSIAQRLGLERGDVIVRINNQNLTCEHDYFNALQNTSHVRLLVQNVRTGRTQWTNSVAVNDVRHPGRLYSQRVEPARLF